jgi:hypothetical protein
MYQALLDQYHPNLLEAGRIAAPSSNQAACVPAMMKPETSILCTAVPSTLATVHPVAALAETGGHPHPATASTLATSLLKAKDQAQTIYVDGVHGSGGQSRRLQGMDGKSPASAARAAAGRFSEWWRDPLFPASRTRAPVAPLLKEYRRPKKPAGNK